MRILKENYKGDVIVALEEASAKFPKKEITMETFLFGLSKTNEFKKAFHGDSKKFLNAIASVINNYKEWHEADFSNYLGENSEHFLFDIEEKFYSFGILTSHDIAMVRNNGNGKMPISAADILCALSCSDLSSDLEDYTEVAKIELDDFINALYKAEGYQFSVEDYDTAVYQMGDEEEPFIFAGGHKEKVNWQDYCQDLLEEAKKDDKPLVGREKELAETIRILCRKEKANPLHLGEAGVGKTAITLGLAKRLNADDVPARIKGAKVYSLDLGSLMAGTEYRGQLEERLKAVFSELESQSEKTMVILYIDEIHMICGAGRTEGGSMDVANLLKPMLCKSGIRVIGATTFEEYKGMERDKALARRFKPVKIVEPSIEDAKTIIKNIIPVYETYHHVKYAKDVADAVVDLSVRYIHDKRLPDKAIDLIDEAGAQLSQHYHEGGKVKKIGKDIIEKIVAESYGIPVEDMEENDIEKLKSLDSDVKSNVFGQDEAVDECVKAIRINRLGLSDGNKPIANLLFVGQTGVGKTEVAVQIANAMGVELIRFDMSEYSDDMSVTKLIGASAGYVGYEDGGLLVDEIIKHPHSVLLLDEIEKASPKVFNTLLQVMDNATLTDNKGRKADFKNVIIIMTSNAGASGIVKNGLGFGKQSKVVDISSMDKAVKETFTPEFRNRLTKVVKFNSLSDEMAESIAKKKLDNFIMTLKAKNINVIYDDEVIQYIKERGITPEFGAREIIRVIGDDVKTLFVDYLLNNPINKEGNQVSLFVDEEKLALR